MHPGDLPEGAVTHAVAEDGAWVEGQSPISTAEDTELINPDLSGERRLDRLFHERGVHVFAALPLRAMLLLARRGLVDAEKFAPKDRAETVKDGKVVVTCEFCSSVYQFTPPEAGVEQRALLSQAVPIGAADVQAEIERLSGTGPALLKAQTRLA